MIIPLASQAQIAPPCGNPPPPGAENCQTACVYCDFDGYTGINNGTPSGGNTVCGAIALHNDQWFGFVAGTDFISIDILTSNCQDGNGLQAAFFDACDEDAIVCNPGSGGNAGIPLNIAYGGFVPGQTYYLMIDGWSNDICNFEISVISGSVTPPTPTAPPPPSGPLVVCPGAMTTYSIPPIPGAGYYRWTAPNGASINGMGNVVTLPSPEGVSVDITFGNAGGVVCVSVGNACTPPITTCINVINQPIPPTILDTVTVCFDDLPYFWEEPPFTPVTSVGTFNLTSTPYDSYLGCDSLVRQTIKVKPQIVTNLGNQFICEGSCFTVNNTDYCQTGGPFFETFESFEGCDSVVRFNITTVPALAQIAPVATLNCANPQITLDGNGSTTGPTVSYVWTNALGAPLGNMITQNIAQPGSYTLVVSNTTGLVTCRDTAQIVVPGNVTPPGVVATGGIIGCLSTNQSVTLQAVSDSLNLNYQWSGPGITPANDNLPNPVVTTPGVYSVVVTNPFNSCTSTDTAAVIADNTPPTALALGDTITCFDPVVTVDVQTNAPNGLFQWSGPGILPGQQSFQNPQVNASGAYVVTVTNATNGCTRADTTMVGMDTAQPTVSAGNDKTITCSITSVVLDGNGAAGGAPVAFLWTGPGITPANQNVPTPTVDQPGLYTLQVTNNLNGCTQTDSVTIGLDIQAPNAIAGPDQTITCAVTSVQLNSAGSSAGANFTALWSGPGITPANQSQYNPVVDQPGVYVLVITNILNGCTATDDATVNVNVDLPTADAGQDMTLTCSTPGGVSLNGSGLPANVTYLWTGPGIGANNQNEQIPTVTQSGPYILLVTDPANGCTSTDQVDVLQDADLPVANAGADQTITCAITSIDLDGSGSSAAPDILYQWSGPGIAAPNDTLQSPTGITLPGAYALTVTNTTNNCFNTDVVVVAIDTAAPAANAGPDLVLNCYNGGADTLRAGASDIGPGFNVFWSGPAITPATESLVEPVVNLPGMYTVLITNVATQCTATAATTVSDDQAPPTADAGPDQTIDCVNIATTIGGNSSSGPVFTYLWVGPDIDPAREVLAQPIVGIAGVYELIVTDTSNGCIALDQATVFTNAVFPVTEAGPDGIITCTAPVYTLDASASSIGANFQITWQGPGINPGNINLNNAPIDQPGTYIATVLDNSNACATSDTVVVGIDTLAPTANAGADHIINCKDTTATLDGSLSSTGSTFIYFWTGAGIQPGDEGLQSPVVALGGQYNLLVTDTVNGCATSDQVAVIVDNQLPTANAGPDITLTCAQNNLPIDGSGSSSGAIFIYLWDGPGINSNNFDQQSPVVADSGLYVVTVTNTVNLCLSTDAVYVALDGDFPVADAGADPTLNCAVDTVTLNGILSDAGAGITYLWTGPAVVPATASNAVANATLPGLYTLTVSNQNNGCSKTDFVTVGEDILPPFADAGSDQTITCTTTNGVTISAAGSDNGPGFGVQWSGPGITPANESILEPLVNIPGTYTVLITNLVNGCTSTDEVEVNLSQNLPVADAGPDQTLTCVTLSVILDAGQSTPAGSIDFAWAGPDINANNSTSISPAVTLPGVYSVTVTNSNTGCTRVDEVTVLLDNAEPALTLTGDTIDCGQPSAVISVVSDLPGTVFLWSGTGINPGNETLATLTVNQPGTYDVVATAPNGCRSTGSTSVSLDEDIPEGAVEGAILNCTNNGSDVISAVISTPGATGMWFGPGGFQSDSLEVAVTQPGNYQFVITASNGCSNTLSVDVIGNFTAPVVSAFAPTLLDCNTTSLTLVTAGTSTGPNFSYQWTTMDGNIVSGANTTAPVVDQIGTYTFLVTNLLNGCADSSVVLVEYDPNVPTGFLLDIQNIRCTGDENGHIIVLGLQGGQPPYLYSLNGESAAAGVFEDLGNGDYLLSLVDGNGCALDTTINISEPGQLALDLGPDQEIQLGEPVTVEALLVYTTPLASISWAPAAPCADPTCLTYTHQPLSSYIQNLTLVDSNGCTVTDRITIIVRKDRLVYVPNVFNPESNDPDNSVFQIYAGTGVTRILKWFVFDRWGSVVHQADNFLPGDPLVAWNGQVNGEDSDNDVYVWFAEIEFIDGEVIQYTGDVTLVRQ